MDYVDLSDEVISVDRWNGNAWAVYRNGKPIRRFYGPDAECEASGYALAILDRRGGR